MSFTNSCASATAFYFFIFSLPCCPGNLQCSPQGWSGGGGLSRSCVTDHIQNPASRKALAPLAVHQDRAEQVLLHHELVQATCPLPGPSTGLSHLRKELDETSAHGNPAQEHILDHFGFFVDFFLSDHPGHQALTVPQPHHLSTGMMKCKYFTT